MSVVMMRRFGSFFDFLARLFDLFRGPTFFMTFRKIEPGFREKILLTVSVTNNCYG